MTDAFRMAEINGFSDVEAKTIGRDEARGDLAGVKRDVNLGVNTVKVVEHKHLAVVLGHGQVGVFGLHEVEADDVGVGGRYLEGEERLGKDLLGREGAEDLVDVTYLDRAGGRGGGLAAVFDAVAGVQPQTETVWRQGDKYHVPRLCFINKMDRESREPLELLDEIEKTLALETAPMVWPIGRGRDFRGTYELGQALGQVGGRRRVRRVDEDPDGQSVAGTDDPLFATLLEPDALPVWQE